MPDIRIEKELVMKKISEIKPYVRNPRKNDKTVEQLCKIIPIVGFNVPLTIDPDGVIIKGHARFTAAIRLGMTELPCIISHASPDEIKADRITDNKISELSEWVTDELKHELDMLNIDFDFSEIGLQVDSLDDIPAFEDFTPDVEEGSPEITEEQRKKLYEEFLKQQEAEAGKAAEAATQMTTQADLDKAKESQKQTATPPPRYYKCVCEKCGHIMFVREGRYLRQSGEMTMKWEYGKLYEKYDMQGEIHIGTGIVQVHDIFRPLPEFMKRADVIFCDPPYNQSALNGYYTKAEIAEKENFTHFFYRLIECIDLVSPRLVCLEVGLAQTAMYEKELTQMYKYMHKVESWYYGSKNQKCNILFFSREPLSEAILNMPSMDEEKVIAYICKNVEYECIGDFCMGKGLVAYYSNMAGKPFVGTELNYKRLAVCCERVTKNERGKIN